MNKKSAHKSAKLRSKVKYLVYALIFFASFVIVTSANQQIQPQFNCLSNSAITPSYSSNYLNDCVNATVVGSTTIVALLFSFFMIALAYLIGQVLNIEQLRGWYKNESWELTKTILLIAIIYILITVVSNIALGFKTSNSSSSCSSSGFNQIYCVVSQYLNNQVALSDTALRAVTGMSIGIQDAKSLRLDADSYLFFTIITEDGVVRFTYIYGLTFNPLVSDVLETSPLTGDSYVKNTFLLLISPMYILNNVLYDIFYVLVYVSLGILIPLGIVFRAIPFLRSAGGNLIALGITGAIIFPLVLMVLNAPVSNFFAANYYNGNPPPIPPVMNSCSNQIWFLSPWCDLLTIPFQFLFDIMSRVVGLLLMSGAAAQSYGAATNGAFFNGILSAVNNLTYYTIPLMVDFILYIADFVLVYAIANGIATQLGGSLRLSLGGKVKLS
ncbi:MAG: hypothetical protein ACP5RQ_02085 [Candidatus Micrarchaeia archaeon]